MVIDDRLRRLEVARPEALWAIADLQPSDARAEFPLLELDEVDQAMYGLMSGDVLSSQELINAIATQMHNGIRLVIEDSIPEPWRQRFEVRALALRAWLQERLIHVRRVLRELLKHLPHLLIHPRERSERPSRDRRC